MKCFFRYLVFSLAFILAAFFTSSFTVNNVSAIDDFTLQVDQSNYMNLGVYYLCGGESGRLCSDYQYFIYDPVDVSSFASNSFFSINTMPYNLRFYFSNHVSLSIISLSSVSSITFTDPRNFPSSDFSFNLTLTNTFPSDCPVCEECQQCPAIPENPYDDKFDKLITAIYVCAATVLVVYFFYCIYRMIIKSSGGFNG